jgi:hypothetical protein
MGQYYKPISLDKKQCIRPWDYDNGAKLMEHSYIGNELVAVVESLIAEGGEWFGDRIVWGGDYADPEVDENGNVITSTWTDERTGVVKPYDVTLYDMVGDNLIKPDKVKRPNYRYLVNMDTKEYVDFNHVPVDHVWQNGPKGRKFPIKIHPLPLLTCEGNSRGGGDYRTKESDIIGKWTRNRVTVTTRKPKGHTEFIFDLVE